MPFKSKAQRRKFAELLVTGEISPEVFEEWNRETGGAELPERVKSKPKRAGRKKAAKRKPARRAKPASRRGEKKSRVKKPATKTKAAVRGKRKSG